MLVENLIRKLRNVASEDKLELVHEMLNSEEKYVISLVDSSIFVNRRLYEKYFDRDKVDIEEITDEDVKEIISCILTYADYIENTENNSYVENNRVEEENGYREESLVEYWKSERYIYREESKDYKEITEKDLDY